MDETLVEIFSHSLTTDKNTDHTYGPVYEKILAPFRKSSGVILELGIGLNGGALRVWRNYFVNAYIVGVDIDHTRMVNDEKRISTIRADLYDTEELVACVEKQVYAGSVNVIIDDGPHTMDQQLSCMAALWPFLRTGGLYCIEDASELAEGGYEKTLLNRWLPSIKLIYDARVKNNRHDDAMYVFEKL